ncbi:MAG: RnfABCDGE type electron transport complex subunit G [bacterium]
MKKILGLGLRLAFVCALAAGILASVYRVTSPIIEEGARQEKLRKLRFVLPGADRLEVRQIKGREITLGYAGQELVEAAIEVAPHGYSGSIRLLVGVSTTGRVVRRIAVLSDKETPGLGNKIHDYWFLQQFVGKDAEHLQLKKDAPQGTIDAISAATISSRAVTNGVQQAVRDVQDLLADLSSLREGTAKNRG